MKNNKKSSFLLFSFLVILVISFFMIIVYFNSAERDIYSRYTEKLDEEYNIIISVHSHMADIVFKNIIDSEPVKKILYGAYKINSEEQKSLYREELYNLLIPLYTDLTSYDIRQLHFHDSRNNSFLRMHKPEKYGDNLMGIRDSVEYVNRERKPISGFEEGRIFNGYRNVYPMNLLSGENLGSVEVSFSMSVLINEFKEKFGKKAQFLLRKSLVDDKVFESEQDNYDIWHIDDNFVLDNDISTSCLLSPDISEKEQEYIRTALKRNLDIDGDTFSLSTYEKSSRIILTFKPVRDFSGSTAAYIFSITDDLEIATLERSFLIISIAFVLLLSTLILFIFYFYKTRTKLQDMIHYDQLTRAFSRRSIMEKLHNEFERFNRYHNPFCIVMLDIDFFKKVNDQYGHGVGDLVLSGFSRIILNTIRKTDFFGRYGGEEFLMILTETDLKSAVNVVENLRVIVSEHKFLKAGSITVSCGIVAAESGIESITELLEMSDAYLYKAKNQGRNKVVFS